jgi:endogenous inhibitor of DNA gyrase (YacG/DUF329 family)
MRRFLMVKCPICGKQFEPGQSPAMPFCSQRCRTVDLGRWLDEKNSILALRSDDPDEEEEGQQQEEESD